MVFEKGDGHGGIHRGFDTFLNSDPCPGMFSIFDHNKLQLSTRRKTDGVHNNETVSNSKMLP